GYTDAYPWTGATTAAANDALANLGQLKNLFSFDLTRDSDGDGIPDWRETKFNLNPFNGQTDPTQPPSPPTLVIGAPNDWQGWTKIGRSDDPGVYGSGSTSASALYDVYANQFYLNAASGTSNIPVGNQYVTGDPTGEFTYSPGAFTGENRILGIGVQGLPGSNVSGFWPTVKFALGDNTYSPATSVPGTDGRVSFSLDSQPGDFTVQFALFGGSPIYRPSSITLRGNDGNVYTLPGGIGSGASYDFAFRAIPLTSSNSYQMFFDLTKMQEFYSNLTKFQTRFDRQTVAVAPGTNYNGEGIGTIGSKLTIALNGISNNTTVFSVRPPPFYVEFQDADGGLNKGFDPPMETDSYTTGPDLLTFRRQIIRDRDPEHPENWEWWTSLGKGPGIAINGDSPGFNVNTKVLAWFPTASEAQLCEIVVVDHADIVSVYPTLPTKSKEPLTIWCTCANGGDIQYATIEIRTRKDHAKLATLKVMVMPVPTQLIPVKLYAIPDLDHPAKTPVLGLPTAPALQKELNDLFYQACLQFEVQIVAKPNGLNWDTNKDNMLQDPETNNAEFLEFANDKQFNGHVPVIFVHKFTNPKVLGFTAKSRKRILINDVGVHDSDRLPIRVIAHEVGHYFDASSRGQDVFLPFQIPDILRGDYHDNGPFPLFTTGLMRPGEKGNPGKWIRHEDWEVLWTKARTEFLNLFPQ
ncbi:MAG: hypothetical protein SCG74_01335, partial [Nitrospiraceae bacterium]|nr:hypothetical protein [Nitrospiraceae bacterium]